MASRRLTVTGALEVSRYTKSYAKFTNIFSRKYWSNNFFVKNGPIPASFLFISSLFKQTIQFLQQINVKKVHPIYGAGIQTHNLFNMSHLP